jgi:6-methylsalicylate decarboxylase
MTVLAHRINEMLPKQPDRVPNGVLFELRKLYFDVANASNPSSLSALTKLVPNTQILFGSDYPFVAIESTEAGLDQFGLSKNDLHAVNRGNAERLFPRWKA